jgi:hypothetical protein
MKPMDDRMLDDLVRIARDATAERDKWRQTAFRLGTMLGNWQGDDPTAIVVEAYEAIEAGCVCQLGQACPEHDDPTKD